ncbi:MAG: hypothetical protein OHK0039_23510 [Bacteroidia bacterium]
MLAWGVATTLVAQAQTRVTGSVTDETGASLGGTTVLLKGTTQGVLSDSEGNFAIEVPNGEATLIFSYYGYERREEVVGGRSMINLRLEPSTNVLSEVVVVGYGTQRQEAVTGSVASLKGVALHEVPSTNVSQALQGRLAGV